MGNLRDREVTCSTSDRQGSNFKSCVWMAVSSHSSHNSQKVLLARNYQGIYIGSLCSWLIESITNIQLSVWKQTDIPSIFQPAQNSPQAKILQNHRLLGLSATGPTLKQHCLHVLSFLCVPAAVIVCLHTPEQPALLSLRQREATSDFP